MKRFFLVLMALLLVASGGLIILAGLQVIGINSINPAVFFCAMILAAWSAVFEGVERLVKAFK